MKEEKESYFEDNVNEAISRILKEEHYDVGDRAFKNKWDDGYKKYGGDDYMTNNYLIWLLKSKKMIEDTTRKVYMKIDNGKDEMKQVRYIRKGNDKYERSPVLGLLSEDELTRDDWKKWELNVKQFVDLLQRKGTNAWGKFVRDKLVYMDKETEACYICNGIDIEQDKLILDMEWGDLLEYRPNEFTY